MNPKMITDYLKTQKKNYQMEQSETQQQAEAEAAAAGIVMDT